LEIICFIDSAIHLGVVGTRKFLYDVWGSSANLASRMESTARTDTIQVSKHVYSRVAHLKEFRLVHRCVMCVICIVSKF
jgi:class 3 adenylate cyclase